MEKYDFQELFEMVEQSKDLTEGVKGISEKSSEIEELKNAIADIDSPEILTYSTTFK